jgi:Asp-tRNA(Asn)/Glu-tRNA(Gln) amidotransferase A subunit family amidase
VTAGLRRRPQRADADRVDSPSAQEQDRLTGLSASEAATAIARGELDSETLVRACLDRIAARDDEVGAWQVLDPEAAVRQARARDRSAPRGPLHGVPVAVKDLIDTADLPTGYGSPIHAGHRPTRTPSAWRDCAGPVRSSSARP